MKDLNMTQLSRDIRAKYSMSFPNHPVKDISKLVKRSFDKSKADYRLKMSDMGGSGRTGPPNTVNEDILRFTK